MRVPVEATPDVFRTSSIITDLNLWIGNGRERDTAQHLASECLRWLRTTPAALATFLNRFAASVRSRNAANGASITLLVRRFGGGEEGGQMHRAVEHPVATEHSL